MEEAVQIHDHVFVFSRMSIHQYLIVDNGKLILIDTGLPGNHNSLMENVSSIPKSITDLTHILITHADGDHYGAVNGLRGLAPNVRVCASVLEAQAMAAGSMSRPLKINSVWMKLFHVMTKRLFNSTPTLTDVILQPGQVLPFLGGLQILDTSGHTPGHLSFYSPSAGILFAGDSIFFSGKTPTPSHGANCWDEEKARQAYSLQMSLQPRLICAGHGFIRL